MRQALTRMAGWLRHGVEAVAAALMAVMFLSFIVTILYRYVLNWPSGWAAELGTVLWIWLVLFGAAFLLREEDEIRFDIVYGSVRPGLRRAMTVLSAIGIVGLFAVSLPAVWDYVTFMKVQRTAYLRIRYDWLYSIYVIFAVAVILRYLSLAARALRGHDPLGGRPGGESESNYDPVDPPAPLPDTQAGKAR
ncbi:TRAP transporter small permease (plasmid) [Paracoccus liaowanqingii]|uniref:TRAP transporter small permease protein n=1 Tax=Paracoccus liaowanqingii TaxID=2560053 RepID=A0A4Y5SRY1_9RHOB|nr:TRAP transporter small permease [Paracoccus liaowanqingii]QDA36237.1 TRAP transporter small permease [Paracoccus liaowanqingii]